MNSMRKLTVVSAIVAISGFPVCNCQAKSNASDYVQRGLVAHWDAADNVGYGTHDSDSTTWKDLTGNGFDWTLDTAKVSWGGGKLMFNGSGDGTGVVPGTMTKTYKDFYGGASRPLKS